MHEKQQILYLWLAENALDTDVIGWAFHDGKSGSGPAITLDKQTNKLGVDEIKDGW